LTSILLSNLLAIYQPTKYPAMQFTRKSSNISKSNKKIIISKKSSVSQIQQDAHGLAAGLASIIKEIQFVGPGGFQYTMILD